MMIYICTFAVNKCQTSVQCFWIYIFIYLFTYLVFLTLILSYIPKIKGYMKIIKPVQFSEKYHCTPKGEA